MAETKMYGVRFLPVLMVIALVCVAAAAGLLAFGGQDMDAGASSVRSMNELLALSQKIPAQANAALNGDPGSLERLRQSRVRYSDLAHFLGGDVQSFDGSTEMLKQSQVILSSSEAIEGVHKAATEVRALVPQLMQSLGNVASALGSPGIDGMTRHLERFELTGLRLQQDMEALAGGVGDATVIARRLADGNDYMGQVVGGLSGEDSGLGLPKLTAAGCTEPLQVHQRAVRAAERESAHGDQLGGSPQARTPGGCGAGHRRRPDLFALRQPRRRAGGGRRLEF